MSATKRFYEAAAAAGMCPIEAETEGLLDGLESQPHLIDWIEYCEFDYTGFNGKIYVQWCITMASARRLIAMELAPDEIVAFVEYWGEVAA